MTIEMKLGPKMTIQIPAIYYRKLAVLKKCSDNNMNRNGDPITNDQIYTHFRTLMEQLVNYLLDATKDFCYRDSAFVVIGWSKNVVELQQTDNLFDSFWLNNIIQHISDQFKLGGLLDQWLKDL